MERNVLILSSDTGGGHRSAALALENSFASLSAGNLHDRILVKIERVLENASSASRNMADLYNFLLRDHQHLMKYYFWAINNLKPNQSRFIFRAAMGYGKQVFKRVIPDAIVSVHPMTQHLFAHLLKRFGLKDRVPMITVVTDPCYGFWEGWACDDVDLYYVATPEAKQQLIDYGVGSHKIQISGMPVHSRFEAVSEAERAALREHKGLDPDKYTLFVNAGWAGGGNIPKMYQELLQAPQSLQEQIQLVFLAGKNEQLQQEASEMAQVAGFPVDVLGFTDEIETYMQLSDTMVTKLGGLTTFEALTCELPIIGDAITPPMPQEEQTGRYIERTGSGLLVTRPRDVVPIVNELAFNPNKVLEMRQSAAKSTYRGASDTIANEVLQQFVRA